MFDWFFSFGVRQLFGGARRGQPFITALGTAITIWGLFRRFSNREKLIYSRTLSDGESLRITQLRGMPSVTDEEV